MNEVNIEERTEIEGVFCPFSGGLCRINCRFLIDIEEGCMIERGCKNLECIRETLDEMQNQEFQKSIYAAQSN